MDSSLNYLNLLPDEMLLKLLSETDDLKTLSKWCQTSKRVNQICQDEGFWHNKYRKDFGFSSHGSWGLSGGETKLMEGETWRERYKQIKLNINSPISGKSDHHGIIDQNGILYMMGTNESGQLGNGTTLSSDRPIIIPFNRRVIGISCDTFYTAALTVDGKIYLWGTLDGLDGIDEFLTDDIERSKHNQIKPILTPRLFNFPHPAIKIYAGSQTLGIITSNKTPYFTGYNKPINIKAIDIAYTNEKYAIIGTDRKLYMWERHYYYPDDVTERKKHNRPQHVPVPELVKQISFGYRHYAVLSISGNIYIWGSNRFGKLGIPSATTLKTPTKLDLPSPISFISMGLNSSAALTEEGKLYMWGTNGGGRISNQCRVSVAICQLVQISTNTVRRPTQISIEGKIINYVEVGSIHTLAVTDDGVVNYWGSTNTIGVTDVVIGEFQGSYS